MKKSILIAGALLVLGASAASAAGVNLSWNDCGTFGAQNATFACNSNSGLNTAVASFDPPPGVTQFLGLSGQVDITVGTDPNAPLPAWWQHGTGFCRGTTGLSVSYDFTAGPFNCADPWAGPAGGFAYDNSFGSPYRARVRVAAAHPADAAAELFPGTEYYAFKINFLRAKTVGAGACAGCSTPSSIVLNEIVLAQPADGPQINVDPVITNPINNQCAGWNSPPPSGCQATGTQNRTWGQIKSLYR